MGIFVEGKQGFLLGGQAWLVEQEREFAWAEKHVVKNRSMAWVLGKYVEADNANDNGQIFALDELADAQKTLVNAPLNLLHRPHYILGSFVASEMLYPTGEAGDAAGQDHPYVEALAAMWRYYFPEEYLTLEKAHAEGTLFFSMECVPETLRCAGGCEQEYAYDGRTSPTYCAHLNTPGAKKSLIKPHFTGGALIIPPVRPGWKKADITELSSLLSERAVEAETAYNAISTEFAHLESSQWEQMMLTLLDFAESAREFTPAEREAQARTGNAMPDGSYPIATPEDLGNAIKAFGRHPTDAVKAHIKKRAKALGKETLLPDSWNS